MYKKVRLTNFRSYDDYTVELNSHINIVVGENATGKTNLLEAVYFLNKSNSFRSSDEALIMAQKTWATVEAEDQEDETRKVYIKQEQEKLNKYISQSGAQKKRFSGIQSAPTVLFQPDHLRLLTGSPETRRGFLDGASSQTNKLHKKNLSQYKRALLQRNQLLKNQPPGWKDQIFVWDLKLSDFGAEIINQRNNLISAINQQIVGIYKGLSDKDESISVEYVSTSKNDDTRSSLLDQLQKNLEKDALRGVTTTGPHRDDFRVIIGGSLASQTASRGETRTLVLALKIIELKEIEQKSNTKPLLLLDDVFSELDETRRRALTKYLSGYQTIITTTNADALKKHLTQPHKIIKTTEQG